MLALHPEKQHGCGKRHRYTGNSRKRSRVGPHRSADRVCHFAFRTNLRLAASKISRARLLRFRRTSPTVSALQEGMFGLIVTTTNLRRDDNWPAYRRQTTRRLIFRTCIAGTGHRRL
ncbi:hypothetical protein, partial [Ralstonia solanacearum]|uniref:hypothetical protein n=1 Tax=Ralstonia solanacearum TaxID=305 RepID=UPI001E454F1F